MHSILMIEDDTKLLACLGVHLSRMGIQFETATDGAEGLKMALAGDYSMVIIDGNLPSMDGFDVCSALRAENSRIPILMLTSRVEEVDKVVGLNSGADDYVTKPFQLAELEARINALLRRVHLSASTKKEGTAEIVAVHGLTVNTNRREVTLDGAELELSVLEYDLLMFLIANAGRVVSRLELLKNVWGSEFEGYEHSVSIAVSRLRSKLGDGADEPKFIHTVRGVGYRFTEPE